MRVKPIRTEEDYHIALIRTKFLQDAEPNSPEANEYDVLNILIEHYEREHAPMGMPDPIESIKIYTEFFNENTNNNNNEL